MIPQEIPRQIDAPTARVPWSHGDGRSAQVHNAQQSKSAHREEALTT